MNTIYEQALKIAIEQSSTIIRLDIQFNFKTQSHKGYLTLSNGHEYDIDAVRWIKIK